MPYCCEALDTKMSSKKNGRRVDDDRPSIHSGISDEDKVIDAREFVRKYGDSDSIITRLTDEIHLQTYFYNSRTGISSWGNPSEEDAARNTEVIEANWMSLVDSLGREFEYNRVSGTARWPRGKTLPDPVLREKAIIEASERKALNWILRDRSSGKDYLYDRSRAQSQYLPDYPSDAISGIEQAADELEDASDTEVDEFMGDLEEALCEDTEEESGNDFGRQKRLLSDLSSLMEALLPVRIIHDNEKLFENWPPIEKFELAFSRPAKNWPLLMLIHQVVSMNTTDFQRWKATFLNNPQETSRARHSWLKSLYNTITEWATKPTRIHTENADDLNSFLRFILNYPDHPEFPSTPRCPFRLATMQSDPRPLYTELTPDSRTRIFLSLVLWGYTKKNPFLRAVLDHNDSQAKLARALRLGQDSRGTYYWFPTLAPSRLYMESPDRTLLIVCHSQHELKAFIEKKFTSVSESDASENPEAASRLRLKLLDIYPNLAESDSFWLASHGTFNQQNRSQQLATGASEARYGSSPDSSPEPVTLSGLNHPNPASYVWRAEEVENRLILHRQLVSRHQLQRFKGVTNGASQGNRESLDMGTTSIQPGTTPAFLEAARVQTVQVPWSVAARTAAQIAAMQQQEQKSPRISSNNDLNASIKSGSLTSVQMQSSLSVHQDQEGLPIMESRHDYLSPVSVINRPTGVAALSRGDHKHDVVAPSGGSTMHQGTLTAIKTRDEEAHWGFNAGLQKVRDDSTSPRSSSSAVSEFGLVASKMSEQMDSSGHAPLEIVTNHSHNESAALNEMIVSTNDGSPESGSVVIEKESPHHDVSDTQGSHVNHSQVLVGCEGNNRLKIHNKENAEALLGTPVHFHGKSSMGSGDVRANNLDHFQGSSRNALLISDSITPVNDSRHRNLGDNQIPTGNQITGDHQDADEIPPHQTESLVFETATPSQDHLGSLYPRSESTAIQNLGQPPSRFPPSVVYDDASNATTGSANTQPRSSDGVTGVATPHTVKSQSPVNRPLSQLTPSQSTASSINSAVNERLSDTSEPLVAPKSSSTTDERFIQPAVRRFGVPARSSPLGPSHDDSPAKDPSVFITPSSVHSFKPEADFTSLVSSYSAHIEEMRSPELVNKHILSDPTVRTESNEKKPLDSTSSVVKSATLAGDRGSPTKFQKELFSQVGEYTQTYEGNGMPVISATATTTTTAPPKPIKSIYTQTMDGEEDDAITSDGEMSQDDDLKEPTIVALAGTEIDNAETRRRAMRREKKRLKRQRRTRLDERTGGAVPVE